MTGVRDQRLIGCIATDQIVDNWGFDDVEAAINALPEWVARMNWKGPNVSTSDLLVSGHSNGGLLSTFVLG